MRYRLTIPARINILGNPTDANEGDFATLSAAVELRAGAWIEPAVGLILEDLGDQPNGTPLLRTAYESPGELNQAIHPPYPYDGQMDLAKAAFNRLYTFSAELRARYQPETNGVRVAIWSQVPRQSGLGGSSLFVLLTLAGLREFYELDRRAHNDYVLSELAQRSEALELGITCGFADRYVPLFGGISYLDYRGKLHQREINQEPYVTIERLDNYAADLPLVAVSTGIQHNSGDVHGRMRPRYLEEHDRWAQEGGEAPPLVRLMQAAYQTAWRGKIALLTGDLDTFGALMNQNHRLVDEMMTRCGFPDGAGWANNLFIQTAVDNGALGAKLTGAGSGGSVFALTRPGEEDRLAQVWTQTAKDHDLLATQVYFPRLTRTGLTVERC